jgi:hypothetical protein
MADLAPLPPPVQRHLRFAGVGCPARERTFRVRVNGRMNVRIRWRQIDEHQVETSFTNEVTSGGAALQAR